MISSNFLATIIISLATTMSVFSTNNIMHMGSCQNYGPFLGTAMKAWHSYGLLEPEDALKRPREPNPRLPLR